MVEALLPEEVTVTIDDIPVLAVGDLTDFTEELSLSGPTVQETKNNTPVNSINNFPENFI